MTPIRIVNVRGLRGDARKGIVYLGRPFAGWPGHRLANPYRSNNLADDLLNFAKWFQSLPTLDQDMEALWAETHQGLLPLGCWCTETVIGNPLAPVVCHAQIVGALLAYRYAGLRQLSPAEQFYFSL